MSPAGAEVGSRGWGNAYLLLALAMLSWAGNAIAGKLAAGVLSPVELTFYRALVAGVIIYLVAHRHVRRDLGAILASWPMLLVLGALGFTGFNLAIYTALNYTTALNVTIEIACMPMVIMLINFLIARQRIRLLQMLGVLLTVAGILAAVSRGSPGALVALDVNRGDAIGFAAVSLYAGYAAALRYKPPIHWLSLMFAFSVGALVAATPLWVWEGARGGFTVPGPAGWSIVLYTAVFPALIAQAFFMRGVELIGSNRAGVMINLVPIFSALLAVVLLGEAFRLYHLAGLVMVLGGIALAERFGR